MKQITLLYHDVIEGDSHRQSGFPDAAAARYKLDRVAFVEHLHAINTVLQSPPITIEQLPQVNQQPTPCTIGFDDGGVSSATIIAEELGRFDWKGHFFITTDWIGKPGFVSENQIRELDAAGHRIGSHTCSHPNPMARCSQAQLLNEWTQSIAKLSDILGYPVEVASIPGGAYGKNVARAAAAAGIRWLFTSEPVRTSWQIDGCTMLGRYGIECEDAPHKAAAFVAEDWGAHAKEWMVWNAKKTIKRIGGPLFYKLRRWQQNRRCDGDE
ncbi:MAG: polysaccharide deacetylase family protein [Planctomycetota bacterium]|nr:polysaccharide deacetylase family protein [Planctomycetota bacterium]